jgi:hypothetical protein
MALNQFSKKLIPIGIGHIRGLGRRRSS